MVVRFYLWWKQIKRRRVAIGVAVIGLVVGIALIIAGYWFDWTGFNVYTVTVKSNTTSGTSLPTNITVYLPSKTLWDWLQMLFIPAVLAVAGYAINLTISRSEQEATRQRAQSERDAAEKRAETEREIAIDNQSQLALQSYIDKMSELILEKKLVDLNQDDEIRTIARARTLTVLPYLDGRRKKSVLQFLHEAKLIEKDHSIVDVRGADLTKARLISVDLSRANLMDVDLTEADLEKCYLEKAKLTRTILTKANLCLATLIEADLIKTILINASLMHANLTRGNLENSNLKGANLSDANLFDANLWRANLKDANLTRASLYGADLFGANLERANLLEANLQGTNFENAILLNANVTNEQLKQAKSLKSATMPDGSIHP